MAIYSSTQSILIPSTVSSITVKLYGAGGGGEGASGTGVYSAGSTGGNTTFLDMIAYGGVGGGVGGTNSGGTGGSYDLSDWSTFGTLISGTNGGNGQITSGGTGGGSSGGNGASTGETSRTVNFNTTRDAGDSNYIYLSAPGYPTLTFGPNTSSYSYTVYVNVEYTLSTSGSGPGTQGLRLDSSTQVGLDDRQGAGADGDYNDLILTCGQGTFYNSGGLKYQLTSSTVYQGRGGGAGGYVTTTITRTQLIANGFIPGSSYLLTIGNGGSAGSGGTPNAGTNGSADISFNAAKTSVKNNSSWSDSQNIYLKNNGSWRQLVSAYVKRDGQWELTYIKNVTTTFVPPLVVNLNQSGKLNVSWPGGVYGASTPNQYKVYLGGVLQGTTTNEYYNDITISSGSNTSVSVEFYFDSYLLYTISKNIRLFNYTGSSQTWTVPAGVTLVTADVQGAQGGNNSSSGGRLKGNITTTPGNTLYLMVGGQGSGLQSYSCQSSYPALISGGWNGGGTGGGGQDSYLCPAGTSTYIRGASGGGASDIRTSVSDLATRLIVAGGGGGGNQGGGLGGGQNGSDGAVYDPASIWTQIAKGYGATTSAGGSGGLGTTGYSGRPGSNGTSGSLGQGGNGGYLTVYGDNPGYAGGGGGGYYGGGGGGVNSNYASAGSGGGGSGYISGGAYEISSQGYRSGDGIILVSW